MGQSSAQRGVYCSKIVACPEDQFCDYDDGYGGDGYGDDGYYDDGYYDDGYYYGICEDCVSNDLCDNIGLPSLGVADCHSLCENAPTPSPTSYITPWLVGPTTYSLNGNNNYFDGYLGVSNAIGTKVNVNNVVVQLNDFNCVSKNVRLFKIIT